MGLLLVVYVYQLLSKLPFESVKTIFIAWSAFREADLTKRVQKWDELKAAWLKYVDFTPAIKARWPLRKCAQNVGHRKPGWKG
jgi:hypothetical protein